MPLDAPDLGYVPTMATVLRRASEEFGETPFLVTEARTTTFAELERASRRLARHLLAIGVGKGTRVAFHLPNGNEWVIAWAAITRIGALAMPLSSLFRAPELHTALRLGDAAMLLGTANLLGRDYQALVEDALPGLDTARHDRLWLPSVPYLRSVHLAGATREWAIPIDLLGASEFDLAVDEELLEEVEREVSPADEMLVIFTSGSTATPKAVVHTHGSVIRKTHYPTPGSPEPRSVVFGGSPFFWVGGLLVIGGALQHGATVVTQDRFEAESALDLIEQHRATRVIAWGSTLERLRTHPSVSRRDLSFIPQLTMPPSASGVRHNSLGMTESLGPHTGGPRPGASPEEMQAPLPESLRGSWGAPLPHHQHKIVDAVTGEPCEDGTEGEVCVRAYCLMSRMYKRERWETFDENGWYHTGDRGHFRAGYLFFTGRFTEMIKTRGANVAPAEVEQALTRSREIELAFVFGVPDVHDGEQVAATLVPAPGCETLDLDQIGTRLERELSPFKVPKRFLVVPYEEVPWLGSGKADRLRLREMLVRDTSSHEEV